MKHIAYTILLYILIHFLSACAEHKVNAQLRQAESLSENQPDSALALLLSMSDAKQLEGKDRADYALLLTKANDKNYISHNSDSLIKIAVDYYAESRDKKRKAEAYFYLGSVYRDMNLRLEAIKAYQEALRTNSWKSNRLTMLAYYNLSTLYLEDDFYDETIEMAQKAYRISVEIDNAQDQMYNLKRLAHAFRFVHQVDSSLHYYHKNLALSRKLHETTFEFYALSDMGHLFLHENQLDSAQHYIDEALRKIPDSETSNSIYYNKANLLLKMECNDSVKYYLQKCLNDENANLRAASRLALSKLEEQEGNYQEALKYGKEYFSYSDSIEADKRRAETKLLITGFMNEKPSNNIFLIIVSISIVLIILIALLFFLLRKRLPKPTSLPCEKIYIVNMNELKTDDAFSKLHSKIHIEKNLSKEERDIFLKIVKEKNLPTIEKLKEQHPKLSENDLSYCILVLCGYKNSEITTILSIESSSIRARKSRIRHKISEDTYLSIFGS